MVQLYIKNITRIGTQTKNAFKVVRCSKLKFLTGIFGSLYYISTCLLYLSFEIQISMK